MAQESTLARMAASAAESCPPPHTWAPPCPPAPAGEASLRRGAQAYGSPEEEADAWAHARPTRPASPRNLVISPDILRRVPTIPPCPPQPSRDSPPAGPHGTKAPRGQALGKYSPCSLPRWGPLSATGREGGGLWLPAIPLSGSVSPSQNQSLVAREGSPPVPLHPLPPLSPAPGYRWTKLSAHRASGDPYSARRNHGKAHSAVPGDGWR